MYEAEAASNPPKGPPTPPHPHPHHAPRAVLCLETKVERDFGIKIRDWTGNLETGKILKRGHAETKTT